MQEWLSVFAKVLSGEFLRTFCGKKYEPCHGLSGGKDVGWTKTNCINQTFIYLKYKTYFLSFRHFVTKMVVL